MRHQDVDVRSEFLRPPKGYGNVPFYWWSGDRLNKERLKEQLDILSESATDGFAVSYIHTDPNVDTLFNKGGYGLFGRTSPGEPAVFSKEWWDIWNWFSGECAQRGLGVGLDDYTVGWVGNGYYPDELDTMSVFKGYQGKLNIETIPVKKGEVLRRRLPEHFLSAVAWPGKMDLSAYIKDGVLDWKVPATAPEQAYTVSVVSTSDSHILHPEHGKLLVNVYFDRFYNRMDAQGREGMNYFFQDELSYPLDMNSWSSDFPEQFERRKGYDIVPYLSALKENIGAETPKIRMDYAEVLTDLAEERYFRPVYDWHAERGLIYGCDNLGRGRDPLSYVDYFRAISWFTAPGNDAPSRGSSFLETKVSSSISHLYNRPRTWLEAFHSMGWGSSGAWLTQQIDHHFIAGGNLVCMHGLYYSTHGGWWEWAPPCFHFRMPYWPHMKTWLQYTERMSYLLSQGQHVCDVALMYPTEAMQAYPGAKPDVAFDAAMRLSNAGLDYDFIDFRSLRQASFPGKTLQISNEKYRVLVVAGMKAMHFSSLEKIRDFYRAGGIVLATGELPSASSRKGENDEEVDAIVRELFGLTAAEARTGKTSGRQTNNANGVGMYVADGSIEKSISALITPDFKPAETGGKVLHRKVGEQDIYMVMNVAKGSECFFRATGKVESWNAHDGSTQPYPVVRQTEEGTWLKMNKETDNSYLLVFSPGTPLKEASIPEKKLAYTIGLDGEWTTELLPTMQNKWGDFRLPASDAFIGAEARIFRYAPAGTVPEDWMSTAYTDSDWNESIYGYGPQAEVFSDSVPHWQPFSFSWQYGVWDNPGAQGYHGLKGQVNDGFFILDQGGKQSFRTYLYADKPGIYRIAQENRTADAIEVDGTAVRDKVSLSQGWHRLQATYMKTNKTAYKSQTSAFHDGRPRGAVVLLPDQAPDPVKASAYSDTIAMRWFHADHLLFDPYGGKYPRWNYRFRSVPGLEKMEFAVYGKELKVYVDGNELAAGQIRLQGAETTQGVNRYQVTLPEAQARPGVIAFSLVPHPGYPATAALAEPVMLKTGTGLLSSGNWSDTGALRCYSGAMYYRTQLRLPGNLQGKKITLRLGEVIATCEVKVNGTSAGILISPPYEAEIGSYLTKEVNILEVLVYSTLANHYQTIPTPYRGEDRAGLIGPVSISVYE